jgi:hypothetical protein
MIGILAARGIVTTMATRDDFRKSAQNKLRAAETIIEAQANLPVEAAYLCTVAVECFLKRVILGRNGLQRSEQIEDPDHQAYQCFHGALGHELERLRLAARTNFPKCAAWSRMKSPKRAYSLRYSTEAVSREKAEEELRFAKDVANQLENEQ